MIVKVKASLVHPDYQTNLPQFLLNPWVHGLETVSLETLLPVITKLTRPRDGEVLLFEYEIVGTLIPSVWG